MMISNLEQTLKAGKFTITAEIGPPKSCNVDFVRQKAELLRGLVAACNLTDNQTAIVRMSSIAAARIIEDMGIETVVQMTCRDRNRIGLQSDILGLAALGIKNLVCLTGDHQTFGNHPEAKNVFDLDAVQLIHTAHLMNEGKFLCGEEIKVPPRIFIGCVENPFADPFAFRVTRLQKKVRAGARFCQTQCVLDQERFNRFMELAVTEGVTDECHILAGIMPLKSARVARYMKTQVAGMSVDNAIIQRLEAASEPAQEGINIAVEQVQAMMNIKGVAGVHIMAVAWEDAIPEIIKRSGLHHEC
ncbi:MAG: methylenetetrahydrofolate reductase [Methylocystaceae bacterium]